MLRAVAIASLALAAGCGTHRFRSRMGEAHEVRDPMPPEGKRASASGRPVRNVASAAAAAAIAEAPAAQGPTRARLPAPHRLPQGSLPPPIRSADELRALVGRRDKRDPLAAVGAWSRELGLRAAGETGTELVTWAERTHRLRASSDAPAPGDLLVFGRTSSDEVFDLVALVVARDPRGVTEFVYLAGGVVRRGFVDASRPALRRDGDGTSVNTYLRHVKRHPPKGTRYLAGELLAHVIRAR